ncbi:MAG TPA: FtsX-like permease family protein [Tahibacter sp.]|nr:FtsX-like permease family protein [Tahibacter sp.]
MEFRPILSALMRSKVALVLIGLQIALTLAIVSNALFIINQRIENMGRASGMNEADTFMISSLGFGAGYDVKNAYAEDLATLRGMPGVANAAPILTVPMSQSGWSEGISLTTTQQNSDVGVAMYFIDEQGLDTYGLKLVGGRNFTADEVTHRDVRSTSWPNIVMITKALGERLWPGQNAVGKQFYLDQEKPPLTVIGVVDRLIMPWPNISNRSGDKNAYEFSMMVPQMVPFGLQTRYLVRAEPGRVTELVKAVEAKLAQTNTSRIVREARTLTEIRAECYRSDRAMLIILIAVIVALLSITALGIVGMASFWVTQRTKQIGTRRALGATRGNILRYFLTENFVITTIGLALGAVLTYGVNLWLMQAYSAQRLPVLYLVGGMIALWLLGQLAVFGPATRASRVPPAVATRSV